MKIYHLIIAYNDKTEEMEYIEEYVEDADPAIIPYKEVSLDPDEWDDEQLMSLLIHEDVAKA